MNRDRHKRLYDLHSWVGTILGLFIFVVSFTGIVALFDKEIRPWENPNIRLSIASEPVPFEPLLQDVIAEIQADNGTLGIMVVRTPQTLAPYYSIHANYTKPDMEKDHLDIDRKWDTNTAEVLTERGEGLSIWLLNFHKFLMLPTTVGQTIVGLAGIFMLLSVVTGIFIHGKIIRRFFSLQLQRSQRLKWQDSHKVLGIIGLPFSLMISFTGALLGVVAILGPIIAVIAFQGNTQALFDKVLGVPSKPAGEIAQMLSMDDVFNMRHPQSGLAPELVIIDHYGDKNAEFTLFYNEPKTLAIRDVYAISGVTGKGSESATGRQIPTPANRVINTTAPLHYGNYGGIWLKWIYAFMGMALCIMIATGQMLWVERRQHGGEGKKSDQFYNIISRTNIGICLGFPLASICLFYLDKLYIGAETSRLYWTGLTYFSAVSGALFFAQFRKNDYKTSKILIILCGALLLGLPILNAATTGATFWASDSIGEAVSNKVDISLFSLGLLTLFAATRIPTKRNIKKPEPQKNNKEQVSTAPAIAE